MLERRTREVFNGKIFQMAVGAGGGKQIQEELGVGKGCVTNCKVGEKGLFSSGIAGGCRPKDMFDVS